MLEVFKGGVPVIHTLERWYEEFKLDGFGAMIPFIGIVRPDNGIEGLSFDLYLPMLNEWFKKWQNLDDCKFLNIFIIFISYLISSLLLKSGSTPNNKNVDFLLKKIFIL